MIDLSDFLIPYPLMIVVCLAVVVLTLLDLRQMTGYNRGMWWLMLIAWFWLGLSYLFGWIGIVSDLSRVSMLRAGLFLLALATVLHLIEYVKINRVLRGIKSKCN